MAMGMERERWPPVYDAEDLRHAIARLSDGDLETEFWTGIRSDDPICQGDVITLDSGVPVLDEAGEATLVGDFHSWLVLGNTCDFARSLSEVRWSQLVPIERFTEAELEPALARELRRYTLFRRFFLPPRPPASRPSTSRTCFDRSPSTSARSPMDGGRSHA